MSPAGRTSTSLPAAAERGVLSALHEVHDQGVLHRDIKPANIIVNEGPVVHRAALIDFGLARSARLRAAIRDIPVGTVWYMSPEQSGLLHQGVDTPSDLYSVGVVLFECLAGRVPFPGQAVGEVLRQHMAVSPPELRALGLAVRRGRRDAHAMAAQRSPGIRAHGNSAESARADGRRAGAGRGDGESQGSVSGSRCDGDARSAAPGSGGSFPARAAVPEPDRQRHQVPRRPGAGRPRRGPAHGGGLGVFRAGQRHRNRSQT
ncbi:MAG: protein kinase [Planctomycetes bacterium]|nr:protein kinase [Planctomycetota bacterium]